MWPENEHVYVGDDSIGEPPAAGGVREAEAACSGAPALPGEHVVEGRAGQYTAATSAQRAAVCRARGTEETSGVHGRNEQVRTGYQCQQLTGSSTAADDTVLENLEKLPPVEDQ